MSRDYDDIRSNRGRSANELVLSDGTFAYTQDTTKGNISIHTGPTVVNVTGQEYPVVYDANTRLFREVELESAIQQSVMVPQGYYVVLENPASSNDNQHPSERSKQSAADLKIGERVNIPGPVSFSLWPRQSAKVIQGHQLRSNEYLIVRVYDEDSARENWSSAVIKLTSQSGENTDVRTATGEEQDASEAISGVTEGAPNNLNVGSQFVIRGTEVSFYIPPTGVEVIPDEDGKYVREAVTLERLQYCILIDESGNKRYERGPAVVFPTPTETFFSVSTKQGEQTAFRPVELNPIQGIHIKVIADYVEDDGTERKEGEELFITGKDTQIYFPREEHSLISYDRQSKHYATAIPAGEGRYVLERMTGKISLIKGEEMLLPDPRSQVIVRRVLSDKQCNLWYPGNEEVLNYNRDLRELQSRTPTSRSGSVSEGEVRFSRKLRSKATTRLDDAQMTSSNVGSPAYAAVADEFTRGSTYTQPRMVTLNTKFQGVPTINVWTNYAVMVVDKKGNRRVEVGPKTILLGYDEDLEALHLSTGKPKTTDRLLSTAYLRVKNNKISDVIAAETSDHVRVNVKVSLRTNFEGEDPSRWFEVENYVKFLTDHVRSVLKAAVRKVTIKEFYASSEEFVRNTILGEKPTSKKKGEESSSRAGMFFEENNMRISDVEILDVNIPDSNIRTLLENAQHNAVASNIEIAEAERRLNNDLSLEEIKRKRAEAKEETARLQAELVDLTRAKQAEIEKAGIAREIALARERADKDKKRLAIRAEIEKASNAISDAANKAMLARNKEAFDAELAETKAKHELELNRLKAETEAIVSKFNAGSGNFAEALTALSNQDTMIKVAQALSAQTLLGGDDFVTVVNNVFGDNPVFQKMLTDAVNKAGKIRS